MGQLKIFLKGFWVGATMTVPGVSGGTMAVVTGIYEDLIYGVNGLRKEPGKHILFLLKFAAGAAAGFLLSARFVTALLENESTGEVTRLFFCGVVAGGIPLLVRRAGVEKTGLRQIFFLICGALPVLALSRLPSGLFAESSGAAGIVLQVAGGLLIAAALILPGISATHMLYILGLYETVLERIYRFKLPELLPLALGGLAGFFLTAGIMGRLLKREPQAVYLIIIGFVAGSVTGLLPEGGIERPLADAAAAALGFFAMYAAARRAD